MLEKYFKIYELLRLIAERCLFEEKPFIRPVLNGHTLHGILRNNLSGYTVDVYDKERNTSIISISLSNAVEQRGYCIANTHSHFFGSRNLKVFDTLETIIYNDFMVELNPNINLSTGEGSDELFNFYLLHPEIVCLAYALTSHYKYNSDVFSLSLHGGFSGAELDVLILNIEKIWSELQ